MVSTALIRVICYLTQPIWSWCSATGHYCFIWCALLLITNPIVRVVNYWSLHLCLKCLLMVSTTLARVICYLTLPVWSRCSATGHYCFSWCTLLLITNPIVRVVNYWSLHLCLKCLLMVSTALARVICYLTLPVWSRCSATGHYCFSWCTLVMVTVPLFGVMLLVTASLFGVLCC